jgi:hypothetical protein
LRCMDFDFFKRTTAIYTYTLKGSGEDRPLQVPS